MIQNKMIPSVMLQGDRKTITGSLLLCALLLFFSPLLPVKQQNRVTVGDLTDTLVLTGSLKAEKAEHLVVPRSNTWRVQIKWMVKEGETVKPGDPVVRFDTSNLASEIENIELALEGKKQQKNQKTEEFYHQKLELEVAVKEAEVNHKKAELDASVPREILSNYEYDQRQLQLKQMAENLKKARLKQKVDLEASKLAISKLEIEIAEEQARLDKNLKMLNALTLKAKTGGTTVYAEHGWPRRKVQVGDNVRSTQTVATIPDVESLLVEAWISEAHIRRIKTGLKAQLILDAYPERRFEGVVRQIMNNAEKRERWGKSHYFMVTLQLESRDFAIMKPGMSVRCIIPASNHSGVRLVPLHLVHQGGGGFYIKPAGKPAVKVTPLGFDGFYLALKEGTSAGVQEGTKLEPLAPEDLKALETDEIKGQKEGES